MATSFVSAPDSGAVKNPDCGCQLLTFKDYTDMLWTTLAEFPGTVYYTYSKSVLGRIAIKNCIS